MRFFTGKAAKLAEMIEEKKQEILGKDGKIPQVKMDLTDEFNYVHLCTMIEIDARFKDCVLAFVHGYRNCVMAKQMQAFLKLYLKFLEDIQNLPGFEDAGK